MALAKVSAALACTLGVVCLGGCGQADYEEGMQKTEIKLKQAGKFLPLNLAPVNILDTPFTIRLPAPFFGRGGQSIPAFSADGQGSSLRLDQIEPPIMDLPGLKITFQCFGTEGGTQFPYFCYIAALSPGQTFTVPASKPRPGASTENKPKKPAEVKIAKALEETTELNNVEEMPLTKVIDLFKKKHQIEIQFDRRAMKDAGVSPDAPITRDLKNVTLSAILRLILGDLGLAYVIRDEVLLITTPAQAEASVAAPEAGLDRNNPGNAKIIKALEEPTELDNIQEMPLAEVINLLRTKHQIEIELDVKALDEAGVGLNAPITRDLKDISLGSVLRLVLRDLGLTYVIRDGVLLITSPAQAAQASKGQATVELDAWIQAELASAFPGDKEKVEWQPVEAPTPMLGEAPISWKRISVTGNQPFQFINNDSPDLANIPGKFIIYMCQREGTTLLIAWRVPNALDSSVPIETWSLLSAGTLVYAPPQ